MKKIIAIIAMALSITLTPAAAQADWHPGDEPLYVCPADWPTSACNSVNILLGHTTEFQRVVNEQHDTIAALNDRVAQQQVKIEHKNNVIRKLRDQVRSLGAVPAA